MSTCARHHNNHNTTHSKQTTRFFGLLHRTRFLGGKCTHQTGYALSEAGFIWSGRNKQKKECGSWETATERPDTFTQGSSLVTLAQWLWEEALRDAAGRALSGYPCFGLRLGVRGCRVGVGWCGRGVGNVGALTITGRFRIRVTDGDRASCLIGKRWRERDGERRRRG